MKVFNSTEEFVEFLEDNEVLRSVTPFADELINMHKNINNGCKCKYKARVAQRDGVYRNIVTTVIEHNMDIQAMYKKYGGFSEVEFKLNDELILKI